MTSDTRGGAKAGQPNKAKLRNFGLTMAVALAVLGALLLWRHRAIYLYFFIAAAAFLGLGLAVPTALKPIEKGWMKFAERMGWVMTRVIMVVMFYVVVTPIGLIARAAGKDFLHLRFDKDARSYWVPVKSQDKPREDYERQY